MFLKNRTVQMKFVKDKDVVNHVEDEEVEPVDFATVAEIVAEHAVKTAVVIGGVVAANRVLKTICDITVIAAKAKLK